MSADSQNLGPESLLYDADGEECVAVRERLAMATRYIANWYKATEDSDSKDIWWAEIDSVRAKVEAAYKAMDPAQIFPGKTALALYSDAQLAFPAEWRKLELSIDTVSRPDLIDQMASMLAAAVEFPSVVIPAIGDSIGRALGGGLGALFSQLWPWLLGAVVVVVGVTVGPRLIRRLA